MNKIYNLPKAIKQWYKENQPAKGLIIVAILFLIVIGYLPTLQRNYFPGDQSRAFRYSPLEQTPYKRAYECAKMVTPFYVRTGRPLVWIGECFEHAAVGKISDFKFLRPFLLAIVLGTALYLGMVLAPIVGGLEMGMTAASLLTFAPGYSFMYFQGFTAGMVLLCLIFATASFVILNRYLDNAGEKRWFQLRRPPIASLFLFIAACMMFPAWAFIVISLTLLYFGFDIDKPVNQRVKRFLITIVFYFIATIIYYLIIKFLVIIDLWGAKGIPNLGEFQFSMNLNPADLVRKIVFLANYFFNLTVLNSNFGRNIYVIVLVLFSIYLGSQFAKSRNGKIVSTLIWSIVMLVLSAIVLIGAESPWLFSDYHAVFDPSFIIPLNLFLCAGGVGLIYAAVRGASLSAKKLAVIFIVAFFLVPLSAVQNELSFLETAVSGIEIEAMRLSVDKWLDNKGYVNNRLLLIVNPNQPMPAFIYRSFRGNQGIGLNIQYPALAPVSGNNPNSSLEDKILINAILHGKPNQPIGRTISMVNCGINQSCAQENLNLFSDKVVILDYNGIAVITTKKPFIINLSLSTSKPVIPKIEMVKSYAVAQQLLIKKHGNLFQKPLLIIQGYKGFNIISYNGKYFGITQNEGAFYIEKVKSGGYKELFYSKSLRKVKAEIFKYTLNK